MQSIYAPLSLSGVKRLIYVHTFRYFSQVLKYLENFHRDELVAVLSAPGVIISVEKLN